jgi:hypothetical protein
VPREVDPLNDEPLFNVIELGGLASPGVVKSISGHERKINWDVKEGAGLSGASSTLKSVPLRTITVTFHLVDEEQIGLWPAFRTHCYSTVDGTKPIAFDIYHPDLEATKVRSVTLASMGGAVHDGMGGQTIAVQFQEYAPPKPKGGSATGSRAKGPDPNAALNAELAALTKQYADTPWG